MAFTGLSALGVGTGLSGALAPAQATPGHLAQKGGAGDHPVVLELFTSQGCYSCPPADRLLAELAGREDIIALSLNVDYWDYLGWKDTLASAANTARQREYAMKLRRAQIYTPQLVIDGRTHVVGSRRNAIEKTVAEIQARGRQAFPLEVAVAGKTLEITVPKLAGRFECTVWVIPYLTSYTADIRRGENRGKEITYTNVARDLVPLATWTGAEMSLTYDLAEAPAEADGVVVMVQESGYGPIRGARQIAL